MTLYTIGSSGKTAQAFFGLLKEHGVTAVADVRLRNRSQLTGFAKAPDLAYFLDALNGCAYIHLPQFAPSAELLDAYREKRFGTDEYEARYLELMERRGEYRGFFDMFPRGARVCLLCAEASPAHCHRRALAELLARANPGLEVTHL